MHHGTGSRLVIRTLRIFVIFLTPGTAAWTRLRQLHEIRRNIGLLTHCREGQPTATDFPNCSPNLWIITAGKQKTHKLPGPPAKFETAAVGISLSKQCNCFWARSVYKVLIQTRFGARRWQTSCPWNETVHNTHVCACVRVCVRFFGGSTGLYRTTCWGEHLDLGSTWWEVK
jgi:hypothetical protein